LLFVSNTLPSISVRPASGCTSPLMQRSSVDLPAPLGPSTTRNSPGFDRQVDALQDGAAGIGLLQAFDLDHDGSFLLALGDYFILTRSSFSTFAVSRMMS
jgi:hypothetical protein